MKITLVRALVVALALAGFSATTVSAKTSVKAGVNVIPTPLCAPGDPNGCGID
jgi:ABC-type nitrate/sulfonate/bicarbonate transport system substrate-binding protein